MRRAGTTAAAAAALAVMVPAMAPPGGAWAAPEPGELELHSGARVGVLNLLDAEVTHFHASRKVQDSFLKTYTVNWPVHAMLMESVTGLLTQMGFAPVATAATEALRRAREGCILNATLSKGFPKECGPLFAQVAAAEHLDALIVLAPGLNDSAHAGGTRRRDLPQYLRGWCVLSEGGVPDLLNLTELLLIAPSAADAQIAVRQWGGDQKQAWNGFTPPADLKEIPTAQLTQLQPLFAAMLKAQAGALLAHLPAAH